MIWLVGNRGMLGTEIEAALRARGLEYMGTDREVDITSPQALSRFVSSLASQGMRLEWLVNCSAWTAVDRAEEEPELCFRLNRDGPENLAGIAEKAGAGFLHFSTDYVFDGTASTPYREEDPVAPTGVYARSKAEGEQAVRATCIRHLIVRTAWLYGKGGKNFVSTMLKLLGEREEVRVVADQVGSPTYASDLAAAVVAMIEKAGDGRWGTYHYTNEGQTSWCEFTREIRAQGLASGLLAKAGAVVAIPTAAYPTLAHRPAYSVLSKEKIRQAFGLSIRSWQEGLRAYLGEIKAE